MSAITQSRLKEVLCYDAGTGVFTWLVDRGAARRGMSAGRLNPEGYVLITIDRATHYAHRLAWLYMTGSMPKSQVDHKNGIRKDNCFENLREASHAENLRNTKLSKANTTGAKGVYRSGKRFYARIVVNREVIHLGSFPDVDAAKAAYAAAAQKHFGEFARVT